MRNKRISLFLPSLRGGGAERVMVNIAKGLADRGFAVDLVLANAEGPYLQQVPDHVNIVDLQVSRVVKSLPALVRYIKRTTPHALISALSHANVIAILSTKLANTGTKIIVSEHNNLSQSKKHAKLYVSSIIQKLMRWSFPTADQIIAVSQGVADSLHHELNLPTDKIKVIYNPIVDAQLTQKAEEDVSHPWFIKRQPPIILSVGRLTTQKDYPTLMRSFANVRKEMEARLVILGEGEMRQELTQLIRELELQEDIDMPGFVDNPYSYMKRASVFVLSSKWEGFGNVLVEAMACGCPVVSTDCPSGPNEILVNGKYGSLVPVGDEKTMARAILETLNAKFDADVLVKRAKDFEVNSILDQYQEII